MHFVLFYDYVPDYMERRGAFRDEHMALVKESIDRGELFLGGAYADPADGAIIVFKADTPNVAVSFAENDPYVQNGLVISWRVRQWTTVVGKDAEHPL